jgi:type I restriction-modification system DNA methylase subunit
MESAASCADADLVAIERAARALRPGGRAVIVVAPGVLFREGTAERVRKWVSEQVRVVAVIGLPHGLFGSATSIAAALLVLERSDPTETLVARLGDDWAEQLRDSGHFFGDYRRHLLGIRE